AALDLAAVARRVQLAAGLGSRPHAPRLRRPRRRRALGRRPAQPGVGGAGVTTARVDGGRARRRRASDLCYSVVIGLLAAVGLLILVGPVFIVLLTSFTQGRSIKFPPAGLSLQWYRLLFDPVRSSQIHRAALNSLEVAVVAMASATILATLASVALARRSGPRVRALD